jgi:hypothetical protein
MSIDKILEQATVDKNGPYNYLNMNGGSKPFYYFSEDYEDIFLMLWEQTIKQGKTLPMVRKIKGNKYNGECTCLVDIDGYPSDEEYLLIKQDFLNLCKKYFVFPKNSEISLFEHINNKKPTKVHLYLLVDGEPVTVRYCMLKRIYRILKESSPLRLNSNYIDYKIFSLRIPGACKKTEDYNEAVNAGIYPINTTVDWKKLLMYYPKNKKIEYSLPEWKNIIEEEYLKKASSKDKNIKKADIKLNSSQIEEILSENTKNFIIENINILELDFNVMLSLYNLFIAWGDTSDDLKEIVSKKKRCSGECVTRLDQQFSKNKKLKLSPQEAFFRLRKKILSSGGDMKSCPVFNFKTYTYEDISISQSFVIGCLMNEDIGLSELYCKLVNGKFVPINPQVDTKNTVGYMWNSKNKLWMAYTFLMLKNNISITLSHIIKQHISFLEKEKETKEKKEVEKYDSIIKSISQILKQVQKSSGAEGAAKYALCNYLQIDKYFINKLNMSQYIIPLRGTKCVDMTSGKPIIREREKEDYFTQTFLVDEVGDSEDPTLQKYLSMFQQDLEVRELLQTVTGQALLGEIGKRTNYTYLLGPKGSNGKSIFFSLLKDLMSYDFCYPCDDPDLISIDKNCHKKDQRRKYADFVGKRIAYFYELDKHKILDSRVLKCITGGDPVGGAKLFEDTKMHDVSYRLFICSNNLPEFTECDPATIDRTIVIPCFTIFGENGDFPKDEKLIKDIRENHLQDFLAWAIEGAEKYISNNYSHVIPLKIKELINQHTVGGDPLIQYLTEYCVFGAKEKCKKSEIIKNFRNYTFDSGYENYKMTPQIFAQALFKEHPEIEIKKNSEGIMEYRGISFNYNHPKEDFE